MTQAHDPTFPCYCCNCGAKYEANIAAGPISAIALARCCTEKCVEEITFKFTMALFGEMESI